MPRVNLKVPYSEKDVVKRLGARWDTFDRVWYVPPGVDPEQFERWLPEGSQVNAFEIVSDSYIIMQARKSCWSCGALLSVYGFMLPPMHKELRLVRGDRGGHWHELIEEPDYPALISQITRLEPSVARRMGQRTEHYRPGRSETLQSTYWVNHCEHCGQKQGDFHLYHEPGGAFDVTDTVSAEGIRLEHIREPFACDGSAGYVLHENLVWGKFVIENW